MSFENYKKELLTFGVAGNAEEIVLKVYNEFSIVWVHTVNCSKHGNACSVCYIDKLHTHTYNT